MSDFRKQWNDTCKAVGLKPICFDTAARIMAIVYELDREDITHCPKLLADIEYIQHEYGIDSGKIPHSDFQKLFAKYAKEIEDNGCEPTEWATALRVLDKDDCNIERCYSLVQVKNNASGDFLHLIRFDEDRDEHKEFIAWEDRAVTIYQDLYRMGYFDPKYENDFIK